MRMGRVKIKRVKLPAVRSKPNMDKIRKNLGVGKLSVGKGIGSMGMPK